MEGQQPSIHPSSGAGVELRPVPGTVLWRIEVQGGSRVVVSRLITQGGGALQVACHLLFGLAAAASALVMMMIC